MVDGVVVSAIAVDAKGAVTGVRTLSETPTDYGFAEEANKALLKWTFASGVAGEYWVSTKFCNQPEEVPFKDAPVAPAPTPESYVAPVYPDVPRKERVAGKVELLLTINCSSQLTDIGLVSETPSGLGFATGAWLAVKHWKFRNVPKGTYGLTIDFAPPP